MTVPCESRIPQVREFFRLLEQSGQSMNRVSMEAGVSNVSIHKWKKSHGATVINLEACLNVLGYELRVCKRGEGDEA